MTATTATMRSPWTSARKTFRRAPSRTSTPCIVALGIAESPSIPQMCIGVPSPMQVDHRRFRSGAHQILGSVTGVRVSAGGMEGLMGGSTTERGGLGRSVARHGGRLFGFGLSVLLLAVASLLLIPAIIVSGGQTAWGSIAVGQSIGAVGAVLVYFGWGHTGPARIARVDRAEGRREFAESVKTRIVLMAPVGAAASVVAALVAPDHPWLAVAGCLSASAIGLTSDWYFVGRRQPYAYLIVETLPRVAGTLAGVLLLNVGAPVIVGPLCVLAGMAVAAVASAAVVLLPRRDERLPLRPIGLILRTQRHGVASGIGSAVYATAPLVLVSVVAPGIQPVYALLDKLQRQLSVALGPVVAIVQGYVPRTDPRETVRRARTALLGGAVFCAVLFVGVLVVGPMLLRWLGAGEVQPPFGAVIVMSAYVAINVWESFLARGVLASYDQLAAVARGTLVGSVVGLPLVVAGALVAGVVGALGGLVIGLIARTVYEGVYVWRHGRKVRGTADREGERR